ncbi:MAG: hypothetical protein ACRCSM_02905 [Sediminibacterium sp.]|jgi:hypothetical protein|nr:hypothetical protein [Chitinophagaceae bacterium]MCA6445692.1 hypothetical protein [Chitinophagaceae bacterium]
MDQLQSKINKALSEWNPIGVPSEIAVSEYVDYIPVIIDCLKKNENMHNCLIDILTVKMGYSYDKNNPTHVKDIQSVVDKIYFYWH